LKIPFRILLALFHIICKAVVYSLGIVVMFIWYFNLKFVAKWTNVMYNDFMDEGIRKNRFSVNQEEHVYKTPIDFIIGKKTKV
jgi:hypothetical protein